MIRLAAAALGVFALSQTAPVQGLATDVRDFRERQFVTGERIGCEIQLAVAATDMDVERVKVLSDQCMALRRKHEQL